MKTVLIVAALVLSSCALPHPTNQAQWDRALSQMGVPEPMKSQTLDLYSPSMEEAVKSAKR